MLLSLLSWVVAMGGSRFKFQWGGTNIEIIMLLLSLQVFAQLLRAPRDDADAIITERFPAPRLVICDQHGSQVDNPLLF